MVEETCRPGKPAKVTLNSSGLIEVLMGLVEPPAGGTVDEGGVEWVATSPGKVERGLG